MKTGKKILSRGFSIPEVLVVLVVIGILIAIAVPIYLTTEITAKKRVCQANLRKLDSAVVQYDVKYGDYPVDNPRGTHWQDQLVSDFIATEPFCPVPDPRQSYIYSNESHRFTCPVKDLYGHYY